MLETKNLVAGYGDQQILHGVSIKADTGQRVALIGPNGCGKSTLLSALFGLVHPTAGQVFLKQNAITGFTPEEMLKNGVAYVLQRRSVFPQLTVYENLQMGAYTRHDREIEADIEHLYQIFPVLKRKHKSNAEQMSGGEQRMLELGRALMTRPQVLLLDEPSAGLAPKVTDEIFDVLHRLNSEEGLTLLIVEQNVQRVLEFAEYGYLLNQGLIELEGPCDEMMNDPSLIKAYLSY